MNKKSLSGAIFLLALGFFASIAEAYDLPKASQPRLPEDAVHLQKISKGIAAVAKHAKQGIVFVSVEKVVKGQPFGMVNPFDLFFGPGPGRDPRGGKLPKFRQKGLGSGFFVDLQKGYVMTNNHVIEGADEINLKLANGKSYQGKVVGRDANTDVAIVQIKEKFNRKGLVQLSLSDSSQADVGDICVAVGAPFGLEASISLGVVSAIGRGSLSITDLGNFIQTDAAINPGNSGGPLINAEGQVIGMNTAIFSKSGGYNGIGFAIPANLARNIANQLIQNGKVSRGYLGVMLSEMDQELAKEMGVPKNYKGALIRQVSKGTPADKAGLEPGDVVVKVDAKSIDNVQHLRNLVGLQKPGSAVKVEVIRDGKRKNMTVKLGNYSDAEVAAKGTDKPDEFGLTLTAPSKRLRQLYRFRSQSGAVITSVTENSPADRAGLEEGDVIVKVNDRTIRSSREFWRLAKGRERLLLRIERQGEFLFVPLRK